MYTLYVSAAESAEVEKRDTDQNVDDPPVDKQVRYEEKNKHNKTKKLRNASKRTKKTTKKPTQMSYSKKKLLRLLDKHVEGPFLQVIKSHILMSVHKKQGNRWSTPDKELAISLYTASPKCYRLLRKMITLPSPSTLKKSLQDLAVHPGFNECVLDALKMKVENLADNSKDCILLFDEMSIKE